MAHISELIPQRQDVSQQLSSNVERNGKQIKAANQITEDHIDELWLRMTKVFGHKWVNSYGVSDDDGTWFIGLRMLTPEQLGHGIDVCISADLEWPPTLSEFRAMCRARRVEPAPELPQLAPPPPYTQEQVTHNKALIREMNAAVALKAKFMRILRNAVKRY